LHHISKPGLRDEKRAQDEIDSLIRRGSDRDFGSGAAMAITTGATLAGGAVATGLLSAEK
jgi:hypothetical protein